ncbi:MAG: terminase large subunit domain-containing protein [Bacteroides faecis]|jgi:predicted phage terminase large subunit-like protein|nr:MAG TPA: Large Terminase [Caudoviricetes sp.]
MRLTDAQVKRKLELERLLLKIDAPSMFYKFIPYINVAYTSMWFHKVVADHCQMLLDGKIKNLMVFMPPQHGKSEIISRNFPAYALGRNPNLKIVGTSYSANLAEQFSRSIQRIIDDPGYQDIFPDTYLNGSNVRTNTRGYLRNVDIFETVGCNGFYKAVGVGGSLTGTPIDIAIIDDPVKDAIEAYSVTYRERVWDWYTSVLLTRLHNESKQLFIMTRWHDDDLAGRILKREADKWTVISIPAIRETLNDGNDFDPRNVGEALWSQRHSLERLLGAQKRSPRFFSALYQQHPTIEGGNIIKEAWFGHISVFDFKKKRKHEPIIFFIDTAYTEKTSNDPTGILGSCMIGNDIYIVCGKKVNMKFPELCRFLPSYVRDNGYGSGSTVRIEPKANGLSVIDQLRETTNLSVVATSSPKDSKETRLNAASPFVESGRVYLVDGDWNEIFIDEVCGFPAKPHDEFVDLLCYSVDYHHRSFNELSDEEILRDFL